MLDKGPTFVHAQFNHNYLVTKYWKLLLKLNQLTKVSFTTSTLF